MIVMTGLVTPYTNRHDENEGLKRMSLLQCQSLQDYKVFWPNAKKIETLEIESIKVSCSKYNILALMYLDSTQSQFNYMIKLMEIPSGNLLQNIPNSLDSGIYRSRLLFVKKSLLTCRVCSQDFFYPGYSREFP